MRVHAVLAARVEALAVDVGRARRRPDIVADSSLAFTLERIAGHTEVLFAILQPSAAELYRDYLCVSGDTVVSIDEALAVAERRTRKIQFLLGTLERA